MFHFLSNTAKQSFYAYAGILSLLNVVQAFGAALFYFGNIWGLCVVDGTTYLYFTLFTPLVYFIYLAPFFATPSTSGGSALVTSTVGTQSRPGSGAEHSSTNPLTSRPTNLFTAGLRGVVNFSYRPQVDDDLLDNEEEFANSMNAGFGVGGLHFNHFNQNLNDSNSGGIGRHLVYSQNNIPRNISTFSIVSVQPERNCATSPANISPEILPIQEQTVPLNNEPSVMKKDGSDSIALETRISSQL